MTEAVSINLRTLWRDPRIKGLERLFDTLLLLLRLLSLSYLLKRFLPEPDSPRRAVRSSVIDTYCVLQLIALVILVSSSFGPVIETVIAGYILFDIYLNLLNIIFVGKIQEINAPPASIERSILLLFMNVLQVILAFAVFYHHWLGLSGMDAFFSAVLVLGTIGYPPGATGWLCLVVSLQVLLDLVLLLLILSSFIGQVTLFRRSAEPAHSRGSSDPLQPTGSAGG
jgi:hypothetical protein